MLTAADVKRQGASVYTDAAVATALVATSRTWAFRYELLDASLRLKGYLQVESATVENSDLADTVKRTITVNLEDDPAVVYLTDFLRPYALLQMTDGGWKEWPVGTFRMTTGATRKAGAAQPVEVTGYDRLLDLAEDAVTTRYVVAQGANVRDAVVTCLLEGGFTSTAIGTSHEQAPSPMEWAPGTPRLTVVNDMLSAIGFKSLACDPLGVPTSSPYTLPTATVPTWTYAVDASSVITPGVDVGLDLWGVPNVFLGVVSEPDRGTLVSRYVNDDPASVLSTVSRGRSIVQVIEQEESTDSQGNTKAVSQAVLDAKVKAAAVAASGVLQTAEFTTGLMPFHGTGQTDLLDYGEGPAKWRETDWAMELKVGGQMSHRYRRTVAL